MISELCIWDMATGAARVLMSHEGHIEAPNWHPDGYLIVNGDGLIYRVPLDSPRLEGIDTGFAIGCNNDHGVSPDGTLLAISDNSQTGQSCIYVLPIGGGIPRRVTEHTPSWWHAWTPDGQRMVYPGARGDRVLRLYSCAVDGSDEKLIVDGFDHVDGPDLTPDGAWIWFNGERDGTVELWRVRPDGSELEQMTDDEAINWFPHPSPDGRHVLYLAYPAGTQGHPGNLEVSLRLMPQDGGPTTWLCDLFGGQGTMNVPCWSPDGSAFAFMRYRA